MADKIPAALSADGFERARLFAGATITLSVVSTLIFGARIYTRIRPLYRLGWDDYIISVAYVFIVVDWAVLFAAVPWVFSGDIAHLTLADVENSFKLAIIAEPIWAVCMASIKISLAFMMLRFLHRSDTWRRFLYFMIAIQLITAIYGTISQLLQCIPLRAAWDFLGVVPAKCWSKYAQRVSISCVSAVNVLTDIVFSLLPITFLRKIQRPLRERILIGSLMALGLFASATSIVKTIAVSKLGTSKDPTAEGITVGMWACVEEQVAFIAACIPCLKSPFQRFLAHFGLVNFTNRNSSDLGNAVRITSLPAGTVEGQSEENILPTHAVVTKTDETGVAEVRMEEIVSGKDSPRNNAHWEEENEHAHDDSWGRKRGSGGSMDV
ncbi:hypothetical protein AOQ84DRAFT_380255 [Glonium stellatum]|uniref:Rhodopsin domain-containing protein n=1 Tax=Glonium stellatum TaxID=574774 RepID=A0A8E2JPE3_9PEZI|nr:hypothetical protein AOQ84DRAFT_380255 [Glonium stellatum]